LHIDIIQMTVYIR